MQSIVWWSIIICLDSFGEIYSWEICVRRKFLGPNHFLHPWKFVEFSLAWFNCVGGGATFVFCYLFDYCLYYFWKHHLFITKLNILNVFNKCVSLGDFRADRLKHIRLNGQVSMGTAKHTTIGLLLSRLWIKSFKKWIHCEHWMTVFWCKL